MKIKSLLTFFLVCLAGCFIQAQQKPNDYLVAKFNHPQQGAAFFRYHDFTPSNTQFLSKEEYRKTPYVIKQFSQNGKFDENTWSQFYGLLREEYNRFCYWDYKRLAEYEIDWTSNNSFGSQKSTSLYAPTDVKVVWCKGCRFWHQL